jgi:hypothetical protein
MSLTRRHSLYNSHMLPHSSQHCHDDRLSLNVSCRSTFEAQGPTALYFVSDHGAKQIQAVLVAVMSLPVRTHNPEVGFIF